MKAIKYSLMIVGMMLIAGVAAFGKIDGAKANVSTNDLADLITIDGLFGSGDAEDLAALIAVDNTIGGVGTEDLTDLILVNDLFGFNDTEDLAALIAVDNIT